MDHAQVVWSLFAVVLGVMFIRWRLHPLYSIPTIGPSFPLLSYIGTYRYFHHAEQMLQEGYNKYKVFKVAMMDQWVVIVSGVELNEELQRIPDSHASFVEGAEELLQTKYTVSQAVYDSQIHIPVIRGQLTHNLNVVFADMVDETDAAFAESIPVKDDEWVSIHLLSTMAQIVARVSNRVFVGLPLCREPVYLETAMNFAIDVMKGRTVLSLVPGILKGLAGRSLPWAKRAIRRTSTYLRPTIEERQRKLQAFGDDWTDKPNDLLMWLIEEAEHHGYDIDLVVQGILVSNFAAIHTSSHSITHALYHLAANPEYMQPLREEIEAVIDEHGWTKTAVSMMWKLDSFMRESMRMNVVTAIAPTRKVTQDISLPDGTRLPAGTLVAGAASATHQDEGLYDHPEQFDPFRFSNLREEGERLKHQFVTTSADYLPFGLGKHACPGRFFAGNELKVMMAYIVLHYDMKFEGEGGRPQNHSIWHTVSPDLNAKVLFRKRQTTMS